MKRIITFLVVASSFIASNLYPSSYYYDDIGRLIQTASESGTGVAYTFDENGNLLSAKSINPPTPPQNLQTSSNLEKGITLTWDTQENVDAYRVYRRQSSNLAWRQITEVDSGTVLFFDSTTKSGTEYEYRLVAVGDGLSAYSQPSIATSGETTSITVNHVRTDASGEHYEIQFSAVTGSSYRFEYSNTLLSADWSSQMYSLTLDGSKTSDPILDLTGPSSLYFTVLDSEHPRYFRLVRIPDN